MTSNAYRMSSKSVAKALEADPANNLFWRFNMRRLSAEERLADVMFLGLRLSNGVDLADVRQRYGVDVWARWGDELGVCIEAGLLVREAEKLRLTRDGMLLSSEVMQVFV